MREMTIELDLSAVSLRLTAISIFLREGMLSMQNQSWEFSAWIYQNR